MAPKLVAGGGSAVPKTAGTVFFSAGFALNYRRNSRETSIGRSFGGQALQNCEGCVSALVREKFLAATGCFARFLAILTGKPLPTTANWTRKEPPFHREPLHWRAKCDPKAFSADLSTKKGVVFAYDRST